MSRLEHEISTDELESTLAPLAEHGLAPTTYKAGLILARFAEAGWSVVQAERSLSEQDIETVLDDEQQERVAALRATVGDSVHFGHLSPPEALACAHFVANGELPECWDELDSTLIGDRNGKAASNGQ